MHTASDLTVSEYCDSPYWFSPVQTCEKDDEEVPDLDAM